MTVPVMLSASEPGTEAAALAALEAGKVVAIPTDTVYGLAARLDRPEAMAAIFRVKGRPAGLALPVLVGRWRQALDVATSWPDSASTLAARFWPGALTVVVPVDPTVGKRLGGGGETAGLRHPDHKVVQSLCRQAGPLATTSANLHGAPPCTTAAGIEDAFATSEVSMVVDGGRCDGKPSTVVDCTASPPVCLRQGAIPWSWIEASLR